MARQRSPNRDKAYEIYVEYDGKITSKQIAELLDEKINNINSWRVQDKWSKKLNKVGAPYGNQNAIGNKGGGAPDANQNARTYGWYSKYYPTESRNLIKEAEEAGGTPLEILWAQIMTQWIAIIRAQKIMHVIDKDEMIKEVKRHKTKSSERSTAKTTSSSNETEIEWEFQFAWDRQATFLNAQSRAMAQLTNMLKKYDDMLHTNWDTVTEEQKLRVEKLKLQLDNPEFKHRKEINEKKIELEKERFNHQKDIDSKKYW